MKRLCFLALFCTLGCSGNYLTVHQERIDREFLASSHVGTPDPRQKDPAKGQRLIVSWDFPLSLYRQDITLLLTVRFWDTTEESRRFSINHKRGLKTFFFKNQDDLVGKKLLTYRVDALSAKGETLSVWEHQLWCKPIVVD